MAVAVDAVGTQASIVLNVLSYTGITVGSGENRALVAAFVFETDPSITLCQWDYGGTPQNLTELANEYARGTHLQRAIIYGLVNPTPGNKTLRIEWTFTEMLVNAISFTGVNQAGGTTSFPGANTATGTSANPSVAIAGGLPTGGAGVSSIACGDTQLISSVMATQLMIFSGTTTVEGGGSYSLSASTYTGVLAGSDPWGASVVGVAPVAEAESADQLAHRQMAYGRPDWAMRTKLDTPPRKPHWKRSPHGVWVPAWAM